ncbi:unnamed protein product [Rotaria sordida]|uniref:Uncharacterized protein n=1 Tax=Rotaria sordida TaxID=392033 RepID=A0A815BN42_9BILA|nr:unnamed protein product [Rotaria sordida]
MAIIVGNSKTQYAMNIQGDDTDIKINIGDTAIKASTDTAAQEVINKVGKTAGKIIESGGDVITAPALWLKDMQKNWLTYMILATIIFVSIVFLYCTVSYYISRKKNHWASTNLVELAKVISNKGAALQPSLALSASNVTSVAANSMTVGSLKWKIEMLINTASHFCRIVGLAF